MTGRSLVWRHDSLLRDLGGGPESIYPSLVRRQGNYVGRTAELCRQTGIRPRQVARKAIAASSTANFIATVTINSSVGPPDPLQARCRWNPVIKLPTGANGGVVPHSCRDQMLIPRAELAVRFFAARGIEGPMSRAMQGATIVARQTGRRER